MTEINSSSHSPRKFLLWTGLVGGLILFSFTAINLTQMVKREEKVDKIPVDTSIPSQLVADFPSTLVYPESSLVHSKKGEQESYSAELKTVDSVPTVASWYVDALTNQGWVIDTFSRDPKNKEVQTIRATKGEQSFIVSVIRNPDNQTKIVLGQWQQIPNDEDEEYQEE